MPSISNLTIFPTTLTLILVIIIVLLVRKRLGLNYVLLLLIASLFLSKLMWNISGTNIRFEQLICILAFFHVVFTKKNIIIKLKNIYTLLLVGLFILLFISSLLNNIDPALSIKKFFGLFPYLLGIIAIQIYCDDWVIVNKIYNAFYKIGAFIIFISLIFYVLYFAGINIGFVRYDRGAYWLEGPMVIANIFGSTAVLISLIAFIKINFNKNFKTIDILIFFNALLGILFSYTRSAWIGIVAGILFILVASKSNKKRNIFVLISGIIFIAIIFSYFNIYSFFYDKLNDLYGSSDRMSYRIVIFQEVLNDVRNLSLFGSGVDSTIIKYGPNLLIFSFFLAVFHDGGIIALLLLLFLYYAVFKKLLKNYRNASDYSIKEIIFGAIVLLPIQVFMNQASTTHQLFITWFLLGLFISIVKLNSDAEGNYLITI